MSEPTPAAGGLTEGATWMRPRLCRLLGRHKGRVGYINGVGGYWLCDNCGQILRGPEIGVGA